MYDIDKEKQEKSDSPTTETVREVFAEIHIFMQPQDDEHEHADCGCFSCDGNPCFKSD